MEQWGSELEQFRSMEEDLKRQGHNVKPPALERYYELELDDLQMMYVNDFYRLSNSRIVMESSVGAIPFSEILSYLSLDLSPIDAKIEDYVEIITYIDTEFRKYHNKKIKQELDRIKNKNKSKH